MKKIIAFLILLLASPVIAEDVLPQVSFQLSIDGILIETYTLFVSYETETSPPTAPILISSPHQIPRTSTPYIARFILQAKSQNKPAQPITLFTAIQALQICASSPPETDLSTRTSEREK